jgi:hypothetical protein
MPAGVKLAMKDANDLTMALNFTMDHGVFSHREQALTWFKK